MRDCNYFDFGRRLTKHNNVGKPPEYFSTSVESELRELIRTLLNTLQSGAKFDYKSTGCKPTAQPIPFNGCFGFEQRLREPGSVSLRRYFSPETALGFFPGEHGNGPAIDPA